MSNLNILIVEGNIREDSEFFIKAAGSSAADNSVSYTHLTLPTNREV